ncbi:MULTISPECIES: xanthine phosphoribosyltransferase [unclassified Gemella]|uniref:xanthine phosphoribosyltransferase n=1 Tax=unclassified Gemella TaxID=2624949 RepID=UPI0010741164|nr:MULTISPECIES: xanthine phosphoribosyltransferase [unclassified Gemella]MBF0710762.1 xanthine phosphoribosyltransferase [Gemella sp. GL1.1]MBF0746669.1 xanthine phosphoribosyltransferase [Gemella sp. 19428wG2_WT2a]NYS28106.1 xanthine phosphoribosyltransferase [Gemella sp. GL1]TFU60019.1 xanthine phosphoribosyltransferase [Gemella sp. WT2a]
MQLLEEMVRNKGEVFSGNIIKVDSFINHQIDPNLMKEISESFYEHFKGRDVTKILTIEASGIAPALFVANKFKVPMLFAKKAQPSTLKSGNIYSSEVFSYTKNVTNTIVVSKNFLNEGDNVLIIDDFLANGQAISGLVDIANQANANVVGVGILIEKSFQVGRSLLKKKGIDVCSLCRIASIKDGSIDFEKSDK